MSFYHSTRSSADPVTSKQAILAGIAPDGGLYVSDELGGRSLSLDEVCAQDYHDTARLVLGTLLDDYTGDEIARCVEAAYGPQWDTTEICPVSPLGTDWLLELYHGPTCAFKDVALQMLPQLMGVARGADGERIMIVTATSGDTGKAALDGFAGVDGMGVTVFYPAGKVSDIQRLQMVTQLGGNVAVCAVNGTFDDCQGQVKRVFADHELAGRLAGRGVALSSANSINVGRLAPQVTYYFDAYAQLVRREAIRVGDEVTFCVPTGNFGDVLAGYYAKRMGLPVRRLIVASNANDVLTDFLTTGTYDRRRDFHKTISPSMDILVSSNLERLLYFASDGDCELVASLMADLAEKGVYTVPDRVMDEIRSVFSCGRADDEATRATIRDAWRELDALIDPHTAVAKHVLDATPNDGTERVCLSTASPYKFCADVLAALGEVTDGMNGFACMDALEQLTGTVAPPQLSGLRAGEVLHDDVCDPDRVGAFVESACARVFL
ncbi:threonine synthase [Olsenella sp. DSM 107455]|uniref:Threonine synthase n=1 Tax=Thermophilibacter gallinarum TaxID=2779357 RepID=A0ABR9QVV0_9ACTN|nr:threonine synthase [Thermophilibacter gallinarum]MBE5024857.1 threonine synthase [Thermophilibacter gallinarum]